jgi:hypothetical protein
MRVVLAIALTVSCILPLSVNAAWVSVGKDSEGDEWFIDDKTIVANDHLTSVKFWFLHNGPTDIPIKKYSGKFGFAGPTFETVSNIYSSGMRFATGNCEDRDFYITKVDLRKQPMGQGESYSENVFTTVRPSPGSMYERVLDKVCEMAEEKQSSFTKMKRWFD